MRLLAWLRSSKASPYRGLVFAMAALSGAAVAEKSARVSKKMASRIERVKRPAPMSVVTTSQRRNEIIPFHLDPKRAVFSRFLAVLAG